MPGSAVRAPVRLARQREARWTATGLRSRRAALLAQPRRGRPPAGAHRVGRRALACDAGDQDARVDRRPGQDAHLRRGRRRHRRPGGDVVGSGCGRWRGSVRCSASRICRRSRPYGHVALSCVSKDAVNDRTVTQRRPLLESDARGGNCAHDGRTRSDARRSSQGRKTCSNARQISRGEKAKGESESGRARGESESRTDKRRRARTLIETFGCQMNVHDSERMAGLLEADGYEPAAADARDADVVVINTCSVREKAEEKLFTRLGELRAMGDERGPSPGRRRRRLRRAAGRCARSSSARSWSTSSSARRR